jgi:hypothetical protein
MDFLGKIKSRLNAKWTVFAYNRSKKRNEKFDEEIAIEPGSKLNQSPDTAYSYYHHYFWNLSPKWLNDHRDYFRKDFRGFGEDAFHAMWFKIFNEFSPKKALEIGVYRGQVISLWGLLSKNFCLETDIHGISPFSPAGDHVSVYLKNIDYYEDVIKNCSVFNKKLPTLHMGYSTDEKMIQLIKSQSWDLIYIDGNHDYEIVKKDFEACSQSISVNGLIVLDDSALYTDYKPSSYSTAGHPGPSTLAQEIDASRFKEILAVGHNRVFKRVL